MGRECLRCTLVEQVVPRLNKTRPCGSMIYQAVFVDIDDFDDEFEYMILLGDVAFHKNAALPKKQSV